MRANPWNAVLCCGHSNGIVTMWTPNLSTPAVKMLTHRGPVTALAVDAGGRYMATGGMDSRLKVIIDLLHSAGGRAVSAAANDVRILGLPSPPPPYNRAQVWDIRAFRSEPVHSYFLPTPARSIDISQKGLCAVGFGSHVQVCRGVGACVSVPRTLVMAAMAGVTCLSPPTAAAAVQVWGQDFALNSLPLHGARPQAVSLAEAVAANTGRAAPAPEGAKAKAPKPAGAGGPPTTPGSRWVAEEDDEEEEEDAEDGGDGDNGEGGSDEEAGGGSSPADLRAAAAARKAAARAAAAAALPRSVHKARAPYMTHELPGRPVARVRFKPFDDVLALGTALGLCSMIVPGAGEPNPDSREADPHQGKKERQEAEVHALLDKLPPTTIALDPAAVGAVNRTAAEAKRKEDTAAAAGKSGRTSEKRK